MICAAPKWVQDCRSPSRRNAALPAARLGKPVAAPVALRRGKGSLPGSLLADQRGAVAFETLIVYSLMLSLLFPLADLAVAGFQFISAWEALRGFGQYLQYNPPADVTSPSAWWSGLNKTIGIYTMSLDTTIDPKNKGVLCGGGTTADAQCSSTNVATSPIKYYAYTTTVTLTPLVLKSVLCPSSCAYPLHYSERFQ